MNTQTIQRLFAMAAPTYDMVNHVLTLGMDVVWRRRAARVAAREPVRRCLDVCSGTGGMAIGLRGRLADDALIVATDLSAPMIRNALRKPGASRVRFVMADARALPFRDESLDVVTISFATRNINVTSESLDRCLSEFHRVLRRGGRFVNLETSQPRSRILRRLVHWYVGLMVAPVGALISGARPPYAYLAASIPRFFDAEALAGRIRRAGFSRVGAKRLLFGVAAIHSAQK